MAGRVIVRGRDILKAPLLDTREANLIELRDAQDKLVAFLVRIFTDDTWGLCTRDDPDWPEMCLRYGFSKLGKADPRDLIQHGIRNHIAGS